MVGGMRSSAGIPMTRGFQGNLRAHGHGRQVGRDAGQDHRAEGPRSGRRSETR